MKLKNALAGFLGEKLPDLHLFRDDLAWNAAGNPYPYLLIDEISRSRNALGSGQFDGYRSENTQVKLLKERRVLRFTLRTVDSRELSGGQMVGELTDQVMKALDSLVQFGSVDLAIPGSSETVHIEQVIYQGANDLPPIESKIPFVHQVALSYALVIHRVIEGDQATSLQTIEIEKE